MNASFLDLINLTTGQRQVQTFRELYLSLKRERDLAIQKIRSGPTELVCGKFRCRLENESIRYFVSQYVEEREEYNFEEFYGINGLYNNSSSGYLSGFPYYSVEVGGGGAGCSVEVVKGGIGNGSYATYYTNVSPSCFAPPGSPALNALSFQSVKEIQLLETWREAEVGTVFYTTDTNKLYCVVNETENSNSGSTYIYGKKYTQLNHIYNKGLTLLQDAIYSVPKKQKVLKEREVSREEFLREPFELI